MADKEYYTSDGRFLAKIPEGTPADEVRAIVALALEGPDPRLDKSGTWRGRFPGGVVRGLRDIPDAGAQLLTRGIESVANAVAPQSDFANWIEEQREKVEAINAAAEEDYRMNWRGDRPVFFDAGRMTGNVIGTLPAAMAFGPAATGLRGIAQSAGIGTMEGLLANPIYEPGDNFWTQKDLQAATGMAGGAISGLLTNVGARILNPASRASRHVATLADEGVTMTPGQLLGGAVRRAEDAVSSVPVAGYPIKAAQRSSIEDFNRAAVNRTLAPIRRQLPKGATLGRESIDTAGDIIGREFDNVKTGLQARLDDSFTQEIKQLQLEVSNTFTPDRATQFRNIIDSRVSEWFRRGNDIIDGARVKSIRRNLQQLGNDYIHSAEPDTRNFGRALHEAMESFMDMVERSSSPEAVKGWARARNAWSNWKIVARAAGDSGATDGVFTPAMLSRAVRGEDLSLGKMRFARGKARMQDLSDAGKAILPNVVPDSGTPERLLATSALAGGAYFEPAAAATAALAALGYSKPAQRLLMSAVRNRGAGAAPAAALLQRSAPLLALGGAAAAGDPALLEALGP